MHKSKIIYVAKKKLRKVVRIIIKIRDSRFFDRLLKNSFRELSKITKNGLKKNIYPKSSKLEISYLDSRVIFLLIGKHRQKTF